MAMSESIYGQDFPEPSADELDPHGTVRTAETVRTVQSRGSVEASGTVQRVRDWLARYILTARPEHLDLLALWAAHTHLAKECYTSPRLQLDSPVPGSGKTTVLEHLERLCCDPVQMASVSSPALLTRMLFNRMRTILIDEADRSLNPKNEGIAELISVLNSGYKRGGMRPVLTPVKGGGWEAQEMPTFAPVAIAGNNPDLPDDTRSRTIRVVLMPDVDGVAEESDWELIDGEVHQLADDLAAWAEGQRDVVRIHRPVLPDGIRGRARERWAPLKRIADVLGGRWPAVVDQLAVEDVARIEAEREEGIVREKPAMALIRHIIDVWPDGIDFAPTSRIIDALICGYPDQWSSASSYGKDLTAQRMGRMLVKAFDVHSQHSDDKTCRGYTRTSIWRTAEKLGIVARTDAGTVPWTPSGEPSGPSFASEPSGAKS